MKNNATFIDATDGAVELNRKLKEYNKLNEQLKDLSETVKTLASEIKDTCLKVNANGGQYQTTIADICISITNDRMDFDKKGFEKDHETLYKEYLTILKKGYTTLKSVKIRQDIGGEPPYTLKILIIT